MFAVLKLCVAFSPTFWGLYTDMKLYTLTMYMYNVYTSIYVRRNFASSNYTTSARNINISEGVWPRFLRARTRPNSVAMSSLLKGPGSTKFADKWPDMQPVVLKLLKQEHVTRDEWQNLFW